MRGFLIAGLVLLVSCGQPGTNPGFDFTHVEKAIAYFETGNETLLEEIAASDAGRHLKKHSDRTGYYAPDVSALDITRDLLKNRPSAEALEQVKELIDYAKAHPDRIGACFTEAEAFLPENAAPTHPVYITWGYDIGVSMGGTASLNFAHPTFLKDRQEIWFYCIHENHHAGVTRLHPMPVVAGLKNAHDLRDFVLYSTMLEGTAVHAAYGARERSAALGNDPDYVALGDSETMKALTAAYFAALDFLDKEGDRELSDVDWSIVAAMSSGERWWYRSGADIAKTIEQAGGRGTLVQAIAAGPEAFFEAYRRAIPDK